MNPPKFEHHDRIRHKIGHPDAWLTWPRGIGIQKVELMPDGRWRYGDYMTNEIFEEDAELATELTERELELMMPYYTGYILHTIDDNLPHLWRRRDELSYDGFRVLPWEIDHREIKPLVERGYLKQEACTCKGKPCTGYLITEAGIWLVTFALEKDRLEKIGAI